mmetsp:Transcript_3063/g.7108  ORF Transcript_3063/g.7108 Transcript_3063/m.7108 type:complete len:339 (-) Transcript_3063:63-1079(-)|eukprot:g5630.t1
MAQLGHAVSDMPINCAPECLHYVEQRWRKLMLEDLGVGATIASRWWKTIEKRYCEPWRVYHTLEHLRYLFELLDEQLKLLQDARARLDVRRDRKWIECAIFFHDVVYDPARSDNEELSARMWLDFACEAAERRDHLDVNNLQFGASRDGAVEQRVALWIRQTAGHSHKPFLKNDKGDFIDAAGSFFLDLDLGILASSPARYKRYTAEVTEEYGSVYSEAAFSLGRLWFLDGMLGGPDCSSEARTTATAPKSQPLKMFGPHHPKWNDLALRNCEAERDELREHIANMSRLQRWRAMAELGGRKYRTTLIVTGTTLALAVVAGIGLMTLRLRGGRTRNDL